MKDTKVTKPLMFIAPAFIIYCFVMIYPMIHSFFMTFQKTTGIGEKRKFVGLDNYRFLFFNDPTFWVAIKNNVIWMVLNLLIPVIMGLILAIILNNPFRGRILARGLLYSPSILSFVAVGVIWAWILNPTMGLLNATLKNIGLSGLAMNWLSDRRTALFSAFLAGAWHGMGFNMVLFLGGLQTIPTEAYECAKVEGANKLQTFFHVTLPLLRETYVVVIALTMINSMKVFDVIYVMTYGGPARSTHVLATWMYMRAFAYYEVGLGTAISWVLLVMVALMTIPYVLHMTKEEIV